MTVDGYGKIYSGRECPRGGFEPPTGAFSRRRLFPIELRGHSIEKRLMLCGRGRFSCLERHSYADATSLTTSLPVVASARGGLTR